MPVDELADLLLFDRSCYRLAVKVSEPNGYEIDVDTDRIDLDRVHHWLSTDVHGALGRERQIVEQSIRGSLNFGVYDGNGDQVAYARVVTDLATFAWICDVYVDRQHRGVGLGHRLVTEVRDYLVPYKLKRVLLSTSDAHGLYARIGFVPLPDHQKWMILAAEG
ncbi:GNAT family N-acetyltransferase [Nocardia sp. NPDC046763]|uniref:GNAT family N-acetyltransferase n=1 Tax=Nocardia sp. NPDC046763 TaxID=3155256 RepID=UPI003409B598